MIADCTRTKVKPTTRLINMRTGEVDCPYEQKDVEVIKRCLDACEFYLSMVNLSKIVCGWTPEDGTA